jgi:hypothetical protein
LHFTADNQQKALKYADTTFKSQNVKMACNNVHFYTWLMLDCEGEIYGSE